MSFTWGCSTVRPMATRQSESRAFESTISLVLRWLDHPAAFRGRRLLVKAAPQLFLHPVEVGLDHLVDDVADAGLQTPIVRRVQQPKQ